MGTNTERILEGLDLLVQKIDEVHQESSRHVEYLEQIPLIINQLTMIESKIDYIHSLPQEREKLLTQVNNKIEKLNEQHKIMLENVQQLTNEHKKQKVKLLLKDQKLVGLGH